MKFIFGLLAGAVSIYSILIFIRIIITWFSNSVRGKPVDLLCKITDPYLNWWRNKLNLRIGFLDLSIIFAIVFVSFVQKILYTLSLSQKITLSAVLVEILMSLWSIFSFIIIFFIVILILRLFAYLTNQNIYSRFWSAIDSMSQPLRYKMKNLFFSRRPVSYLKGIIFSTLILIAGFIAGRFIVILLAGLIYKLPI
ncbi:MAG: YggT family protein [Treponema sp.]|nr:YggT family protein [Treponema sp.]